MSVQISLSEVEVIRWNVVIETQHDITNDIITDEIANVYNQAIASDQKNTQVSSIIDNLMILTHFQALSILSASSLNINEQDVPVLLNNFDLHINMLDDMKEELDGNLKLDMEMDIITCKRIVLKLQQLI